MYGWYVFFKIKEHLLVHCRFQEKMLSIHDLRPFDFLSTGRGTKTTGRLDHVGDRLDSVCRETVTTKKHYN